jgi:hypothetical protein
MPHRIRMEAAVKIRRGSGYKLTRIYPFEQNTPKKAFSVAECCSVHIPLQKR